MSRTVKPRKRKGPAPRFECAEASMSAKADFTAKGKLTHTEEHNGDWIDPKFHRAKGPPARGKDITNEKETRHKCWRDLCREARELEPLWEKDSVIDYILGKRTLHFPRTGDVKRVKGYEKFARSTVDKAIRKTFKQITSSKK
jgi:hypothetical protein